MKPFYYIVPGLFTQLENPNTWDYQAQLWLHEQTGADAAGFNYFADAAGGDLARDDFADKVASDLIQAAEAGYGPIDAVGHSNGCAILVKALLRNERALVRKLHLIAAAIDQDCDKNGINEIVARDQVESLVLYVSADDDVLGSAGMLFPGYGQEGKLGPTNLTVAAAGMATYPPAPVGCRHNDWVGKYFEATVREIAGIAGGKGE